MQIPIRVTEMNEKRTIIRRVMGKVSGLWISVSGYSLPWRTILSP